jgi:hypothetical protein
MRFDDASSIVLPEDERSSSRVTAGDGLRGDVTAPGSKGWRAATANEVAMPEPRAQRTLVKSPPELWAELSDLEALARHLGEFGEIRITRLEPETTVAWEGDRACGTVELEPAGWGTKVTITAQLAPAEAPTVAIEAVATEPKPLAAESEAATAGQGTEEETPEPVAVEPEPVASEPEPVAATPAVEPERIASEPEPVAAELAPEPVAATPAPEPRVGFFARLFGRRKDEQAAAEPAPVAEHEAVAADPDPEPLAAAEQQPVAVALAEAEPEPEPAPAALTEPEPDPLAEAEAEPENDAPRAPAPLDDDRAHEILTGVLDDLGSAHHRPFSRG